MPRDPEVSRAAARIAGTAHAARLDADGRRKMNEAARAARAEQLRAQFAAEVDPDGTLAAADPVEFDKRMTLKRKEHFARLAHAGVKARKATAAVRSEERRSAVAAAEMAALADADLLAEESA